MNSRIFLLLICLLALALRIPAWFTEDGKSKYTLFEPDEYQHVEIAIYQLQLLEEGLLADKDVHRFIYNARGFGIQLGIVAYGLYKLGLVELTEQNLVVLGRMLATFYALLLIFLTFQITKALSGNKNTGLLAALLIAIFDLNVTSSHYAIPAVAYVFWAYASVFWIYLYIFKKERGIYFATALPALGAALTFALKYDFIPILVMGSALLWHFFKDAKTSGRSALQMLSFFLFFVFFFQLITCFAFPFGDVKASFLELYEQNKNVVEGDRQWLHNPILYLFGLLGGTSLLVFLVFWPTLFQSLKPGTTDRWKEGILFFLWFLFLELMVRLNIDTPFIRRLNIFLPFMAMVTAYGLYQIYQSGRLSKKWRLVFCILLIGYTLGVSIIAQSNFWWDTRYKTRDYLAENHPNAQIRYSPYAWMPGMSKGVKTIEEADLFVIHETYYGRYWKFFTTPFKIPECCAEVYHCESEEVCLFYQNVLSGREENLDLIQTFETLEVFPERILFKQLFGTYETFLGDVRIYKVLNQ